MKLRTENRAYRNIESDEKRRHNTQLLLCCVNDITKSTNTSIHIGVRTHTRRHICHISIAMVGVCFNT